MKRYSLFILLLGLVTLTTIGGCNKDKIQDFGAVEFMDESNSIVKINMASAYPDDRYMIVKFNDVRVTPKIRGREPYPGGGYNTRGPSSSEFLMVKGGDVEVKVVLPKTKDDGTDSVLLYKTTLNIKANSRYTFHVTDTGANTKVIPTEETFALPDSSYASYRFVNLIPNVPAVDLYYGFYSTSATAQKPDQDSLVLSNIKYGEISPTFVLNRAITRTWKVRPAGAAVTNATVLAFYANAGSTLNQRQYTAYAMGWAGKTDAIMKPYISFMLVR
ncbi:DUF4397 domain-containing protein [Sphingobacterium sp. PU5-4]|uniref:DUF4397 domain-containing protein n=1 Tax=Sphingobacterium tenebrionis TaxID=3111775 RepID=A0ABU8I7P5_9SPHI